MNKKIFFVSFLSIGNVVGSILVYFLLGDVNIPEFIAVYTSILTASYAVLAEPKVRTEPYLRITPTYDKMESMFRYNVDIWIQNIGYSIAKSIKVNFRGSNPKTPLKNNGVFEHDLLAPNEIIRCSALEIIDFDTFNTQQVIIAVSYSNEDDKEQKPIRKTFQIKELEQGLREVKAS